MTLDARLGYRDNGTAESDWTEIAHSVEERKLDCEIEEVRMDASIDIQPFFSHTQRVSVTLAITLCPSSASSLSSLSSLSSA